MVVVSQTIKVEQQQMEVFINKQLLRIIQIEPYGLHYVSNREIMYLEAGGFKSTVGIVYELDEMKTYLSRKNIFPRSQFVSLKENQFTYLNQKLYYVLIVVQDQQDESMRTSRYERHFETINGVWGPNVASYIEPPDSAIPPMPKGCNVKLDLTLNWGYISTLLPNRDT